MTSNLSNIFFVQDFFREELLGGAESNDSVLISHLSKKYSIKKIKSHSLTGEMLENNKKELFIFSNFTLMPVEIVNFVAKNNKYIIYEHDHKYVNTRDPSRFKDFLIPKESIINYDFYKNAIAVIVLSKVCKKILEDNLNLNNIFSIGSSLWSKSKFDYLRSLSSSPKKQKYAVLNSGNPVKGRLDAIRFCEKNNLEYTLVGSNNERDFLKHLSTFETLIFFPQVLETFCRLAAEAKMLNCSLLTKARLLGFYSEECSKLKGEKLIKDLEHRVGAALELFDNLIVGAIDK
tara:strand:- start:987 stop:1856 length:870 start_codon:yes stop_codon:yes gene_type:complete